VNFGVGGYNRFFEEHTVFILKVEVNFYMISGFCCNVDETCIVMGYYNIEW
jgi:hypothetical protein